MKFTTLMLFALFTISCGKIDSAGTAGVGGVRELAPLKYSTAEFAVFDQVCQALTKKGQKLASALPNSLVFDVVEKDCAGKTVTFNSQQVRVEANGTGFQYRRSDTNTLFLFPNVETSTDGVLKPICGGEQNTPYIASNGDAVWVRTGGFSNSDCPSESNEQCLVIEHGSKQGTSNSYLIHTVEFLRINITSTSGKYGYVTHRKSLATNNCDQGDNTESQATLR